MMSETTPSHKDDLLRELRAGHEALAATLRALTLEQLTRPGVYADDNGEWTVKDILAHITWWEQSCFGWLGLPPAVQRSAIPQGLDGDDAINAAIFEGNRDRALDDVLASFERSFAALVGGIEAASEEQIDAPRASTPDGSAALGAFPWQQLRALRHPRGVDPRVGGDAVGGDIKEDWRAARQLHDRGRGCRSARFAR